MNKNSRQLLNKLLTTPSVTGHEEQIQKIVRNHVKNFADSVETDYHGNVIAGINTKAKRRVLLAGHCDQIGFMVKHITPEGYIYVSKAGGIDVSVVAGARATIHSEKGPVVGVFGKTPIHLLKPEERKKPSMEIDSYWVDIGARDEKAAQKLVEVGDPVTYQPGVLDLQSDLVTSPGLDDKVGLFVALEALRLCSRKKLDVALYAASTVQEEVGLRGARTATYGVDPEVGIAIDVCHATDNPGNSKGKESPCKLGSGPAVFRGPSVNPVVFRKLTETAKKSKISIQKIPSSTLLSTDATAIQSTRSGVASAHIGIPNRYMHTQVEVCSLKDIENAAKLIAAFVQSITARTNFKP